MATSEFGGEVIESSVENALVTASVAGAAAKFGAIHAQKAAQDALHRSLSGE